MNDSSVRFDERGRADFNDDSSSLFVVEFFHRRRFK